MQQLNESTEVINLEPTQTDEWQFLVVSPDSRTINATLNYTALAHKTLNIVFIQQSTVDTLHINQIGTVATGATVNVFMYTLGSAAVVHTLTTTLADAHATSNVYWQFYGQNSEQYSLDATNIFNGTHGSGQIFMRGIAEHTAFVRCNGLIKIGLHGGQTDAYLTQNVLMLDATAKVDAIPGLEIKTNDVKASHSATVSRITEEDLFYFGARGIPEHIARQMFIEGFLEADVDLLPIEGRELVRDAIQRKMRLKREIDLQPFLFAPDGITNVSAQVDDIYDQ